MSKIRKIETDFGAPVIQSISVPLSKKISFEKSFRIHIWDQNKKIPIRHIF